MTKNYKTEGFTLVETILYVAILSTILVISSMFVGMMLGARVTNQSVLEVEQQAVTVIQEVTQAVRNAEGVVSPAPGNSATSLSLTAGPIVFDLDGGTIRVSENGGPAVELTNSRVIASDLEFHNLSRSGTPGTIRVSFVLTHVNPDGRKEYDFTRTFHTTASLRQP